jgi:hypothetical protein
MAAKVTLVVSEGVMAGRNFSFKGHNTFLFGRGPDCHMRLAKDPKVSRHHFIIEVNPPDARIRDLGSLNGTWVNGTKHGSRQKDETPEEAAKRHYPEVDLREGDHIEVGDTVLTVRVEIPVVCCECNCGIADSDRQQCVWIGGTFNPTNPAAKPLRPISGTRTCAHFSRSLDTTAVATCSLVRAYITDSGRHFFSGKYFAQR